MPWPRLYSLSHAERTALSEQALEEVWAEYTAFWGLPPSGIDPNREVQLDQDEEERGDFR